MSSNIKLTGIHVGAARKLLRISQQDLAAEAGVSEATVKNFEAGLHDPRPATLKVIREALEAHGIEFMNGGEPGVRLRPSKATKPPLHS
jgi:transcriptional regulator with XRE-family HTH domain